MKSTVEYVEVRYRESADDPTTPELDESVGSWTYARIYPPFKPLLLDNLDSHKQYIVQARTVTHHNTVSPWVQTFAVNSMGRIDLLAPTNVSAVAVADGISVSWTVDSRVPADMQFEIERGTSANGPWTLVGSVKGQFYTDPIVDGGTYWYRVRAGTVTGEHSDYAGTATSTKAKTVADGADVSTIVSPGLMANPYFEQGDYNWVKGPGFTIQNTGGPAMSGSWFAQRVYNTQNWAHLQNITKFPVKPGQEMSFQFYAKAGVGANGTAAAYLNWYDAGGTFLSTTYGTAVAAASAGSWTAVGLQSVAAVANAAFATFGIEINLHTTGTWYVDQCQGYLQPPVAQITGQVTDLYSDSKLTPAEKTSVYQNFKSLWDAKTANDAQADQFGVARTNYDNALTDLKNYLGAVGYPAVTNPLTYGTNDATWRANTSDIDGTLLATKFSTALNEEIYLLNGISDAAKVLADAAQTTANTANSAANNANTLAGSKTKVIYKATAPTDTDAAPDVLKVGDLWFDTATFTDTDGQVKTKYDPYKWSGSAWVAVKATAQVQSSQIADAAVTASKIGAILGGGNLLRNSSFEYDSNADGLADGWFLYNNGGDTTTYTTPTGGMYGGKFQRITWAASNTNTKGILTNSTLLVGGRGNGVPGGWLENQWYVVSFYAKATGTVIGKTMNLMWNNAPQTQTALWNPALTANWQRYAFKIKWNVGGPVPANSGLWISIVGTGASGDLDFDAIQIEEGEVATSYAPLVGEVLPGTISSTELAAASVTSSKLGVDLGGGNLLRNSSFEVDSDSNGWPDFWVGAVGISAVSADTVDYKYGTKSLKLTAAGGTTTAGMAVTSNSASDTGRVYLKAGTKLTYSIYAKMPAGYNCYLVLKTYPVSSGGVESNNNAQTVVGTGAWQRAVVYYTTPVDGWIEAGFRAIPVGGGNVAAGTIFWVDGAQLEVGDVPTAYAPKADELLPGTVGSTELAADSVIAAKIAAGAVTTAKIAAGAVTANEIVAGAVVADKIASGAVATKNLTIANFDNLWPNPSAELAPPSGYVVGATDCEFGFRTQITDDRAGGTSYVRRLTGGAGEVDAFLLIPANEGDRFYIEWWGRKVSGANSTGVYYTGKASDGTTNVSPSGNAAVMTAGTWTKYSAVIGPMGAGTKFLRIYPYAQAGTVGEFDDLYLRRMADGSVIVDGSVTAAKIAANTITANEIAGTTITGAKVAADTITGDKVAANAITTKHLSVMNFDNLVLNPSFEDGFEKWLNENGTKAIKTAGQKRSGTYSMVMLANAGGTAYAVRSTTLIPCELGQTYYAEAWFWGSGGLTAGNAYLRFMLYDAAMVYISGYNSPVVDTSTGGFVKRSVQHTIVAANAAFIRVEVVSNVNNADVYVDDVFVRRLNDASLIVDGTITGTKIAADTITAGNIAAGAITAAEIAAGAVVADKIATNSIFAKHLTLANMDNLIPNAACLPTDPSGVAWPTDSYEASGLVAASSVQSSAVSVVAVGSLGSVTVPIPTGARPGDLYVLLYDLEAAGASVSGWTRVSVTGTGHSVFWKRATAAQETSVYVPVTQGVGRVIILRGVRGSGDAHEAASAVVFTQNTQVTAASITTATSNALVMFLTTVYNDSRVNTTIGIPASGPALTKHTSGPDEIQHTTNTYGGATFFTGVKATPGATGTETTNNTPLASGKYNSAQLIAFPPGTQYTASPSGYVRRVVCTNTNTVYQVEVASFPVNEGDRFLFTAKVFQDVNFASNLGLNIYDKNGVYLTQVLGTPISGQQLNVDMPALTAQVPMGVGAAYARPVLRANNTTTAGQSAYFYGLYCRRMAEANLIVDGSITAAKIAANTIKTSNYAYTGVEGSTSEVATAGAKMQTDGTALLVAPGNLKIGSTLLSDSWLGRQEMWCASFSVAAGGVINLSVGSSPLSMAYSGSAVDLYFPEPTIPAGKTGYVPQVFYNQRSGTGTGVTLYWLHRASSGMGEGGHVSLACKDNAGNPATPPVGLSFSIMVAFFFY